MFSTIGGEGAVMGKGSGQWGCGVQCSRRRGSPGSARPGARCGEAFPGYRGTHDASRTQVGKACGPGSRPGRGSRAGRRRGLTPGICVLALLLALALTCATPAAAREIRDMTGRIVAVPETIERVFAVSPPGTFLVYALDPGVVVGLNFPLSAAEKRCTAKGFHDLPVIGGLVGQGRNLNQEVLLAVRPDVVVIPVSPSVEINKYYEEIFRKLDIPWVNVRIERLDDYPEALVFMGELLGKEDRAGKLRDHALKSLKQVRKAVEGISESGRPGVYYADGTDGLHTERAGSIHAELIEICGGVNVHAGEISERYFREKISLEKVVLYDPEVILVRERSFFQAIRKDPRWAGIQAVQEGRCFLIPHAPFNWFDRPPSFMRLLGARWLVSVIHPGLLRIDILRETRDFYRLFLGVELSQEQALKVLGG